MNTDPEPGEVLGHGEELLDVLAGEHAGAGGHVAEKGHVPDRARRHGGPGGGVEAHLHGPGLGRVATQIPLALEHGQMGMDGRGGGQPDGFADLPHRRRVALLPQAVADELEDLESLAGQCLGHVALLVPVPPSGVSSVPASRGRRTPVRDTVLRRGAGIKHLFDLRALGWDGAVSHPPAILIP